MTFSLDYSSRNMCMSTILVTVVVIPLFVFMTQALAFAPVVDGKSCIIADQSGSGKTLAYLVPVIQRLREEELQGQSISSPGCPRVIVLVPTAELASQVDFFIIYNDFPVLIHSLLCI